MLRIGLLLSNVVLMGVLSAGAQTTGQPHAPEHAPEPGTYTSSMMTSWLTVTPKSSGDPTRNTYGPKVNYGVGSMPMKGLFGDLILHQDGTYSFTADKHGGTWQYVPEKNTVTFTGWLSPFKVHYDGGDTWLTIYTGDVKMPDGGTLNILYRKQRSR